MISALLLFFGATLTYTGYLALERNLATGFAVAVVGLILMIKPALDALRYWKTRSGPPLRPREGKPERRGKPEQKGRPRELHLRIVKSDEDKPTIH